MNLLQALVLGVLQGTTEFLPVSSSGHLVLVPWLLGWPPSGLAFDTMVHWGTAVAVVIYFWRDWVTLVRAAFGAASHTIECWLHGTPASQLPADARLAGLVLLGTVPAAIAGYLLDDFFERMFARPAAAAAFLLVTAILLALSEWLSRRQRDLDSLTWLDGLLIGLAQALAILPGISRSGATIAAGLARGIKRQPAARFSFLLATPIILGAGGLKLIDLLQAGTMAAQAPTLVVGFVGACVVGLGCIHFLLRYLQRGRLYPFAIYCAVAGSFCLVAALVGLR